MSEVFKVHGWRKDKAVFEVEILNNANIKVEDVRGISKLFNTTPYKDSCSGCQFTLSFVLKQGVLVFYHPYLSDQEDYSVDDDYEYCSNGFYEMKVMKDFKQKDWEF